MMYKAYHGTVPKHLAELFHLTSEVHNYNLRGSNFGMQLPKPKANSLKKMFCLSRDNSMECTSELCQRFENIKWFQS